MIPYRATGRLVKMMVVINRSICALVRRCDATNAKMTMYDRAVYIPCMRWYDPHSATFGLMEKMVLIT